MKFIEVKKCDPNTQVTESDFIINLEDVSYFSPVKPDAQVCKIVFKNREIPLFILYSYIDFVNLLKCHGLLMNNKI